MKNLIYLLSVIFLAGCASAKSTSIKGSNNNTIKKDFSDYLQAIADKEFATAMEYLIPEFFDIFPKQEMINIMEETFTNPLMVFKIKESVIQEVAEIEKEEEKYYSKLSYDQELEMKMNDDSQETEAEKKLRIEDEKGFFNQSFGENNVKYNEETGFFNIKVKEQAIGVSQNGTSDWKFIVIQKGQMGIVKKLIPERILAVYEIE